MAGFLDFLKSTMGSTQAAAPPMAASGPGSASDPFKALPTLGNQGFLSGIDPKALAQAAAGMQDSQDPAGGANPAMQQLMQMQGQRQALIQQLLGGR